MSPRHEWLRRLARHAGIEPRWRDVWGQDHVVPPDSLAALLQAMGLPATSEDQARATLHAARHHSALPATLVADAGATTLTLPPGTGGQEWVLTLEDGQRHQGRADTHVFDLSLALPEGYHRLQIRDHTIGLIAAPARCFTPDRTHHRDWGLAVQLYALRSDRQWGIGDFTDLATLVAGVADQGGKLVGVNPLHALFPACPDRISPYAPSSRLFLNPLYIDVTAVPDFAACPPLQRQMTSPAWQHAVAALPPQALIDYPAVAKIKSAAFDLLWQAFRARHLGQTPTDRGRDFRRFQADGGDALRKFAQFHVLQAQLLASHGPCWRDWPEALRVSDSQAVAQAAPPDSDAVEQHQYLQWEADRQLGQAASGRLYRDLAVGTDPYGADSWRMPHRYLTGATIGAPPDLLNLQGQNWGLTSLSPAALAGGGYDAFVAMLRANMRHAGGLRVDHVMALNRLFLIPESMPASAGAYIRYPFADLLRIVALESRRHRCLVVGEDLGTVPRGFRHKMAQAGILSCRVLPFERNRDGAFKPPAAYPALAAASAGTHDLPPLKAWWLGDDLRLRDELGLYPNKTVRDKEFAARPHDRQQLLAALRRHGDLSAHDAGRLLPNGVPAFAPTLTQAVHKFLCASPARLVLLQAEDLLGLSAMVNMPGTFDQHPNWRRRLDQDLPALLQRLAETMS